MMNENNEKSHAGSAGGTGGAASHPSPRGAAPGEPQEETPAPGAGDVEIPLGIPVSTDEWNELKESARRPARAGEDADKGPEPRPRVQGSWPPSPTGSPSPASRYSRARGPVRQARLHADPERIPGRATMGTARDRVFAWLSWSAGWPGLTAEVAR